MWEEFSSQMAFENNAVSNFEALDITTEVVPTPSDVQLINVAALPTLLMNHW